MLPSRRRKAGPGPLVVALAYDGLCTFELGLVVEVFGLPRPELEPGWYRFAVARAEPGPLRATGGLRVEVDHGLRLVDRADLVVVPGWRSPSAPVPAPLVAAVRRAVRRGARVMSICSGVFVLAAAGVLTGRRATTHWRYFAELAARYPAITLEPDVLYVDEGQVLTSAGSAAGLDLCLHLVRTDYGVRAANSVARRLVMPPHRDGGQAQYVERPVPPLRDAERLGPLLDEVRARPGPPPTVTALARRAAMSPRTFMRRFKAATGASPGRWLTSDRVHRARALLEEADATIEEVAEAAGFPSAAALRHHFRRELGLSPRAYRARFGPGPGATSSTSTRPSVPRRR